MNSTKQNIKKIISLMQLDDSVDAPNDAIKWSKNLFIANSFGSKKSVFEKVLAVLRIDLLPNKAVFGERSTSASQERQMLFEAGENNAIDLRILQTEEGFTLKGQILGESFENADIKLGDFETKVGDLNEFRFIEIPIGTYDLSLKTSSKEILLADIELT